jgi:hypothetical protein
MTGSRIGSRGLGNGGGSRSRSQANFGSGGGNVGITGSGIGILGFGSAKLQLTGHLPTPSTGVIGADVGPPLDPVGGPCIRQSPGVIPGRANSALM